MTISENYKKLSDAQVDVVADVLKDAWQNPEIPTRQYEAVVRQELHDYRNGKPNVAFDSLKTLLSWISDLNNPETTLLDVGASSGYYSDVLKVIGFQCQYTGVDLSTYFKDLAGQLFPDINFHVGSATELPFADNSFDIVLHGACIMHVRDYHKAVLEAARVAKRYVIFHRTPVYLDETPTEVFMKTAYGIPCVEIHFNELSIFEAFSEAGLILRGSTQVFLDGNFGHKSYLLEIYHPQ